MGTFNIGQCECCGGWTPGVGVNSCSDCAALVPDQIFVELSGITNESPVAKCEHAAPASSCTDCAELNGGYIIDWNPSFPVFCRWSGSFDIEPCPPASGISACYGPGIVVSVSFSGGSVAISISITSNSAGFDVTGTHVFTGVTNCRGEFTFPNSSLSINPLHGCELSAITVKVTI